MRSALFLALSAATLLSCADKPPTAIVVALSSEAPVPTGVTAIQIQVTRGGASFYDQVFTTRLAGDDVDKTRELTVKDIPGTLTLRDDGKATGPVTVTITATLAAVDGDNKPLTARRVGRVAFVGDKQRLLRMPVQFACAALGRTCTASQSCRAGQCIDDDQLEALDSDFEDADEAAVVPEAGSCFRKDAASDSKNVAEIPVELLVQAVEFHGTTCTVPSLFPSIPADATVLDALGKLALSHDTASAALLAQINQLRAQTNMGYLWSSTLNPDNAHTDLTSAKWTVVDRDPHEGWCFDKDGPDSGDELDDQNDLTEAELAAIVTKLQALPDDTKQDPQKLTDAIQRQGNLRISLSPGLCQVLLHDTAVVKSNEQNPTGPQAQPFLLGTLEQRGTPSKTRSLPTCAPATTTTSTAPTGAAK